ncbi:MAG: DUF3472 domain-containing protein [Clostridia bacterium]|nr:DUF3472 domain-containing protein [Clostridia bacterium]
MKRTIAIFMLAFLLFAHAAAQSEAAPYMVATVLYPQNGVQYEILEGQWMCRDVAENTYYCLHNWYNASGNYTGIVDGSGYAGFQYKDGQTWAILSIWDTETGHAGIEYAPPFSVGEPFGGEGEGLHILVPYAWETGIWYTMRVQAWSDSRKTYYEMWVKPENGDWEQLAVISYSVPNQGFTWDCFFLEDWMGNDLSRSCYLRGYYARKDRVWVSLSNYAISNYRGTQQNVTRDCYYGSWGLDAIYLQSGGSQYIASSMPGTLSVHQDQLPETVGFQHSIR